MRVYYLTSSKYAINNLRLSRLKISRFEDLNDPFELLAVNLADKVNRSKFKKLKDDINKYTGLICFSKDWKNPLLWGHYADKHTGVALGFDIPDELLLPVIYANKLIKITYNVNTGKPSKGVADKLLCTKFKDWKYENEVRLFVQLDKERKEKGLYFEPFTDFLQLKEVILGPRCKLTSSEVNAVVNKFGKTIKIIKSRIAFTRFEVLENKKASNYDKNI